MSQTVLITGTSSGIGRGCAKIFQQNGWNVMATMRNPANETELNQLTNTQVTYLDVLNRESIKEAVEKTISIFGDLDVLINNAGYGLFGPVEAATFEQIEKQYNTNVLGTISVVKAVIPHFRKNQKGTIVNVTSLGGRATFPMNSLYHGTKYALEGFSESLYFEMQPFNIKVKIIEPGGTKSDFMNRSLEIAKKEGLTAYDDMFQKVADGFRSPARNAIRKTPEEVGEGIYEAVIDQSEQLRYIIGEDAKWLLTIKEQMTQKQYFDMIKSNFNF